MIHRSKYKSKFVYFCIILTTFLTSIIYSYDNSHFYRARFFPGEPRFERDYLTSFDITFAGGSSCKSKSWCGQDTCLLDICGCYNMQYLGKNVPNKDLSKETDLIMHQLEQVPSRCNFGILSFSGRFKTWEVDFSFCKNFKKGFFVFLHVPYRKLEISNVRYKDVSCTVDETCSLVPCPGTEEANTYWQAFLNMLNPILRDYKLSISGVSQKGIGDVSFAIGYTINHEEADFLDFVDATVKLGVVAPTSKIKNENYVFSLPLGYNGHTGIFASFDTALGLYDWATLGLHIDAIWFNRRNRKIRIKTACEQSGLIKLAQDTAKIKHGSIYNGGIYFKADHFVGGFSLLVGYSYSTKQKDELDCFKDPCTDCNIANSDCALRKWEMHTIHFWTEYDLTKENRALCPRLNAFYNLVAGGKRIFKTGIGGGGICLDITWD
ncbi:hypothetical protein ACFLYU_00710 [Candidatus Dependentiae bacterium]